MGNKGPGPGPVWPISQHFSPRTLSSSTSSIRFRSSQSRPLSLSRPNTHGSPKNSALWRRSRPPQPALQASLIGLSHSLSIYKHIHISRVYYYLPFISQFTFFSHQVNKAAGPFDALICVGQFFPESPEQLGELTDYIEGRSQVPLPTYFIGDYGIGAAKHLLSASKDSANLGFKMDGLKVCQNLFWLKGSGKFNLHGTLHIFFNVYFCNYYCSYYSHFSRLLQLLKYFNAHCTRIYLQCKQTNPGTKCSNLTCNVSKEIIGFY